MNKAKSLVQGLMVLTGLFLGTSVWAEGFTESWYMSRGQANMEIGNYKAAIEAFEKVVELNPGNREAMRNLGLAYEKQGLKDKAIEQFDRYLNKYEDDPEIAFKQAQALEWSRYAHREKDMLKYYRMGLKQKDDPKMRLKYATYLARSKETSPEAIVQYEKVLAKEPRSVEAHRGLAKAYAWLGNNDQALYHTNLALQYAKREPGDMTTLRAEMMRGREPMLEGTLGVLIQPEKPFELYGVRLGSRGKMDLTPFTTSTLEAGIEHFRDSSQSATGEYLSLGTQVRFNPTNRLDGVLEYHGVTEADGLAFKFEYTHVADSFSIRPGVRREFRYDSFAAFVGSRTSGQLLGVARSHQFYTTVNVGSDQVQVEVTPFVGWVSAESLSNNEQVGLDLKTAFPLQRGEAWDMSAEYLLYVTHYESDQSGFRPSAVEPLPGGYFSPRVFLNQIPRVSFAHTAENKNEFYIAAGPAVQYIDQVTKGSVFRIGGDAHTSYTAYLSQRFLWKSMADFTQIASVYIRFQLTSLLVYTF
ncbi:MAG TPA: tetratricopeptide repeat protein [Nitrospiraceae bacterium]|nr:tetratricopeptide repeat protein [Nitrospiraceae bacterium]